MNKKLILTTLLVVFSLGLFAQQRTTQLTLYKQFKPSTITLKNGKKIKQEFTNVFLKNSSLVYLQGDNTMEANMANIAKVEFDDRSFTNVNNQLAYIIDSVGSNILYRVDIFDLEAYNQQLRNNVNINAIPSFTGDMISTTATDLNNEGDYTLPVFPHFFILYNGEIIRAHEREVSRHLPKDKEVNRKYRTVIDMKGFSWTDNKSLSDLLKAITVID